MVCFCDVVNHAMFVFFFSADVGFVGFNRAEQLPASLLHGLANPMVHEPRCLLGDADLLCELDRGDSLAAGRKKVYRNKPFSQRDFALAKNRARLDGEVALASRATIPTVAEAVDGHVPAVWAVVPVAKPHLLEERTAGFFVFVVAHEVNQAGESLRVHELSPSHAGAVAVIADDFQDINGQPVERAEWEQHPRFRLAYLRHGASEQMLGPLHSVDRVGRADFDSRPFPKSLSLALFLCHNDYTIPDQKRVVKCYFQSGLIYRLRGVSCGLCLLVNTATPHPTKSSMPSMKDRKAHNGTNAPNARLRLATSTDASNPSRPPATRNVPTLTGERPKRSLMLYQSLR